jgi:membrane protein
MKAEKLPVFDFKNLGKLLKRTFTAWNNDDPFRMSAVVSYYALFSLPALLVLIINLVGAIYGEAAIEGRISREIGSLLGDEVAEQVETMIAQASQLKNSLVANIISIATLIFGSTGAFFQLQKSLNIVWSVKEDPEKGFMKMLFARLTSFGLVLVIAFLLLISLIITTALSAISNWISGRIPDELMIVFYIANLLVSFGIIVFLFAMIFKILPDVKVPWHAVWMASILTGLLFVIAKFLLGFYFGQAEPDSAYGAAGSVVLIMLWISYSCMILFFGAEFTRVYAEFHNINPKPSIYAVRVKEEIIR